MSLKSKSTKMPPVPEEGESQPKPVKKKVKSKTKSVNWGFYIMKVLRQVHPTLRISKQAMTVMVSCVEDTFDRISMQANRLCRRSGSHSINTRDIQSAVRLVFPGELSRHAVSEGCKAVINHKQSGGGRMAAQAEDEELAEEGEEGDEESSQTAAGGVSSFRSLSHSFSDFISNFAPGGDCTNVLETRCSPERRRPDRRGAANQPRRPRPRKEPERERQDHR
eukprot:s7081_g2.t2